MSHLLRNIFNYFYICKKTDRQVRLIDDWVVKYQKRRLELRFSNYVMVDMVKSIDYFELVDPHVH